MTVNQQNWPMICTQINVPAAGWNFQVDVSVGAQYDTNISVTIPEGVYFLTGFGKFGDDLLATLGAYLNNELNAYSISVNVGVEWRSTIPLRLVFFAFGDSGATGATGRQVRLKTSASNTDLVAALGFTTTDSTSTAINKPYFRGTYQPAYVWYSSQAYTLRTYDHENAVAPSNIFSRTIGGNVSVVERSTYRKRRLGLYAIRDLDMFSGGKDYTEQAINAWERNRGFECFHRQAMLGKRFRVYHQHWYTGGSSNRQLAQGATTAGSATTFTDSAQSFETDPDRWGGNRVAFLEDEYRLDATTLAYVAATMTSNTATVITCNQIHTQYPWASIGTGIDYFLFDIQGEEYYLDLENATPFEPSHSIVDHIGAERWDVELPLIVSDNESDPSIAEPS